MEGIILASAAIATVYIGSEWSTRETNPEEKHTINKKLAALFPVFGGLTLVGMYLILRYYGKEYIQLILQGYGSFAAAMCFLRTLNPKSTLGKSFSVLLTAAITFHYVKTKHWFTSNLLAWTLAANSISMMRIDSFATGAVLLACLFVYDIYFVFGTDVMVTVATGIDIPAKYVIPNFTKPGRFSMLGLGDIVMPGLMVSLMQRFDVHNAQTHKDKNTTTPYLKWTLFAYTLGLAITNVALYYFRAAQPALLYLSPASILAPLLTAWYRKELTSLFAFRSEEQTESDKKKDESTLENKEN
ncbi:intramembrane aspartyl protease of the perinuclear ER membrane Ypf1 [Schizosaccharomyces osmophilus]|uniref:Intramembrane aspartyl protease of the perinuclear ER membrane Ypf1 n=1 Tax=Schizosaccharomyces osmophilus TaxID=2545709 RepID=A0AAE9WK88_9SCHI|nr:intramembrane aspartyl protease of the perinuclear ER membrane Ypf1 [Schizosaccharomyces osmophilus]WBW75383.1 intramembrane aspartyl protease of the perinuclear ER membrane Ypf1 [Schizosaccharomyces osmophilus]